MFISTVDAMHANLNAVSNVLSSPVLFAVLGLVAVGLVCAAYVALTHYATRDFASVLNQSSNPSVFD
jgi:hypothetical protein